MEMQFDVLTPISHQMIFFHNSSPLILIAGPCAIESRTQTLEAADCLSKIAQQEKIQLVFKSSYDKANRTSISSFRGVGIDKGLDILQEVREKYDLPVITDVHTVEQVKRVAEVADILQIPAFLSRQTDLIIAAANAGKALSIKKGQFLSPWDMKHVVAKATSTGNRQIAVCERGACFGYGNLVVDMRSLEIMKGFDCPVIFDATHSVQLPGAGDGRSSGQREFVHCLAKAAVSVGIAGLFLETHPDPDSAPCDGQNMIAFNQLPDLIRVVKKIDEVVKNK